MPPLVPPAKDVWAGIAAEAEKARRWVTGVGTTLDVTVVVDFLGDPGLSTGTRVGFLGDCAIDDIPEARLEGDLASEVVEIRLGGEVGAFLVEAGPMVPFTPVAVLPLRLLFPSPLFLTLLSVLVRDDGASDCRRLIEEEDPFRGLFELIEELERTRLLRGEFTAGLVRWSRCLAPTGLPSSYPPNGPRVDFLMLDEMRGLGLPGKCRMMGLIFWSRRGKSSDTGVGS